MCLGQQSRRSPRLEMMDHESPSVAQVFNWTVLAGFGGAVKFFVSSLKDPVVNVRRSIAILIINICISGFSGLMGALLTTTLTSDMTWHLISAGIFGYLGTQGLDIITLLLQKKIGAGAVPVSSVMPVPPSVDPAAPQNK